jgi:hypothetical protein
MNCALYRNILQRAEAERRTPRDCIKGRPKNLAGSWIRPRPSRASGRKAGCTVAPGSALTSTARWLTQAARNDEELVAALEEVLGTSDVEHTTDGARIRGYTVASPIRQRMTSIGRTNTPVR